MNRNTFIKSGLGMSLGILPTLNSFSEKKVSEYSANHSDFSFTDPLRVEALLDIGWIVIHSGSESLTWGGKGVQLSLKDFGGSIRVALSSQTPIKKIRITWKFPFPPNALILNEQWERTYGDSSWSRLNPDTVLPWYFLTHSDSHTEGFGVKTGCSSLCWWQVEASKFHLTLDVRNGDSGVKLGSREINLADLVYFKGEPELNAFQVLSTFCSLLCERPRLPTLPIYGINDWYYAYGNSTDADIIRNCIYFSSLGNNPQNPGFCVIDAGWATKPVGARLNDITWSEDQLNSEGVRFKNMQALAQRIKLEGFRPGIWTRPLCAAQNISESRVLPYSGERRKEEGIRILDPSIEENRSAIQALFIRYKAWGYELIKHDFTTWDLFGLWGFDMIKKDLTSGNWHFYDETKTTAEIILNFYRSIREASADTLIIGCNTLSHLSAGIFDIQRIGDDTSGKEWSRTRKMGINTLAFRLAQNNRFYAADADCVGLTTDIPWGENKAWLDLLSRSSTPLFISATTEALTPEVRHSIKEAFTRASQIQSPAEPLDWMTQIQPRKWKFGTEEVQYNWD